MELTIWYRDCDQGSAALARAEDDDVDRTDFSDKHLQEDGPIGPHEDVDPASLMPNLADEGSASPRAAWPNRPAHR